MEERQHGGGDDVVYAMPRTVQWKLREMNAEAGCDSRRKRQPAGKRESALLKICFMQIPQQNV